MFTVVWQCSSWQGAFLGQKTWNHLVQLSENKLSLVLGKKNANPPQKTLFLPSFHPKTLLESE